MLSLRIFHCLCCTRDSLTRSFILDEDILNSAITGSTADAETWALVQGWLDACTEGHRTCSSHAAKGFAPTRLLELDGVGWEQTFRLVDSAQLTSPMEPYVTLSHCWGPGPVEEKLRLVHATEDMLRNGMPASRLPRLFRDALEIADRLGVRYIWIDRLCIIQDSAEDWATEAATMQTVYQNGFLNIAALGAKSDKDGCFFDRDPLVVAPTIINISPPGHEPLLFRFELEEDDGWRSTFEGEPLVSRAWVLQERVLAARTLYFGSKQVFWECHEANRCETDPARNLIKPAAPSIPHPPRCSDGKPVQSSWKMLIDPGRSSIGSWRSIVQSYSHCGLTFANDKLVAISGLAKDMSKKMKRQGLKSQPNAYLAGLWKDEMPASLLWHMESPAHRRPEYCAPSWSWASLDGIMGYGRGPHRDFFHANIVGARTVLRGEDAMGEVIGGSIVLSGPLCVLADGRAVRHFDDDREHHLFRTLNHPDTGLRLNVNYTRIRVDFDAREDHQEVVLLVICSDPNEQWGYLRAIGLALAPVQGIPSRFRRVGFVEFKVQAEEDEVIDCEKDLVNRIPNKSVEIV